MLATALISVVEAACLSKLVWLVPGVAVSTMGAAILDGGSHVCQLPRQGVCKLSIGALGGSSSSVSVYNDNDDDNDDKCTMTQISCFTRAARAA